MEEFMWFLLGGLITLAGVATLHSLANNSTLKVCRTVRKVLLRHQYNPSKHTCKLDEYVVNVVLCRDYTVSIAEHHFQVRCGDRTILSGKFTANRSEFFIVFANWPSIQVCEDVLSKMKEYK